MNFKKEKLDFIEGKNYKVNKITCDASLKERLKDFGFEEGIVIKCFKKSLFRYPISFIVKGNILGLNKNIISYLHLSEVKNNGKDL